MVIFMTLIKYYHLILILITLKKINLFGNKDLHQKVKQDKHIIHNKIYRIK